MRSARSDMESEASRNMPVSLPARSPCCSRMAKKRRSPMACFISALDPCAGERSLREEEGRELRGSGGDS